MPADTVSDARLLQAVQRRDVTALAQLYDRHARAVYGLAYQLHQDGPAAEAATLAAVLTVWRHADAFDPQGATVRGWLLALVYARIRT